MKRVGVLLSSYNGESYIKEQVLSIVNQDKVDVSLFIRDDGSTDLTVEIIKRIQLNYPNVYLFEGINMGCELSFYELIYSIVDCNYDYYAFSDQDDIWFSDKLINSISMIEDLNSAALSSTNLLACDSNMNPIRNVYSEKDIDILNRRKQLNYLCNIHGCVLLWNQNLQKVMKRYKPNYLVPHDVWVCAVANVVGFFYISSEVSMKYRLHNNNVSGLALSIPKRIVKGVRLYLGKNHMRRDLIAHEILIGFSDLVKNSDKKGFRNLRLIANYKKSIAKRIHLIFSGVLSGYSILERLFWSLCIICGKY